MEPDSSVRAETESKGSMKSDRERDHEDYGVCLDCGCEVCQCSDDLEEYFDCGLDRHGNCGKVGSEECDFDCPYRNLVKN